MKPSIGDLELRVERLENSGPGCFTIMVMLACIFFVALAIDKGTHEYKAMKDRIQALEERVK